MDLTAEPLFKGLPHDPATLVERYQSVRRVTEDICAPLATEDYVIQAAPEASPAKWHLGHVSWFFESFVLGPHLKSYKPVDANYRYIFNSYYNGVGPQFSRPARGHPLPAGPGTPLPAGPGTPLPAGPGTPLPAGPGTPLPADRKRSL